VSLKELTAFCAEITGNSVHQSSVMDNRVGDVPIYITDNSRVQREINWTPEKTVRDILYDIFLWIKSNEKILEPILN
jgi:CDP-paratose 2-epimerase